MHATIRLFWDNKTWTHSFWFPPMANVIWFDSHNIKIPFLTFDVQSPDEGSMRENVAIQRKKFEEMNFSMTCNTGGLDLPNSVNKVHYCSRKISVSHNTNTFHLPLWHLGNWGYQNFPSSVDCKQSCTQEKECRGSELWIHENDGHGWE